MGEKKKTITVRLDCDTNRLYGPIEGAIAYLEEVRAQTPDATLDEHWWGYEDMTMSFVYTREETDEEFARRLEEERRTRENLAKEREREKAKESRRKQYEALQREFGR